MGTAKKKFPKKTAAAGMIMLGCVLLWISGDEADRAMVQARADLYGWAFSLQ